MTRIKIDGVKTDVDFKHNRIFGGVYYPTNTMRVWGQDLAGRRCVVAHHTIKNPELFMGHLNRGGRVKSSGHVYSL